MKTIVSASFVACWAMVVACAGKQQKTSVMSPPPTAGATEPGTSPMPGDPRSEIDRLSSEIDAALANAGIATMAPAACAASQACTAEPYDVRPRIEDTTCKPAANDTCTQSCTLSDSVCDNAGKICELAAQLGGADAYANEKCQSGNESCKRTREKCCGCS